MTILSFYAIQVNVLTESVGIANKISISLEHACTYIFNTIVLSNSGETFVTTTVHLYFVLWCKYKLSYLVEEHIVSEWKGKLIIIKSSLLPLFCSRMNSKIALKNHLQWSISFGYSGVKCSVQFEI